MSSSITNVKMAAFATTTALAAVTITSVVLAATSVSTIALVAYSILGITGAALSGAAITAYLFKDAKNVNEYFENFQSYAGYAIAGSFAYVAQVFVNALVQGGANAVYKNISRKFGGPDVTYGRV